MYCKYCGKEIHDDSKFCSYCGKNQIIDNGHQINKPRAETISKHIESERKVDDEIQKLPKYDETYTKEYIVAIVGGGLILINFLYLIIVPNLDISESDRYSTFVIINFIWRLIGANWCTRIANRQNRSLSLWGLFGFFTPNLALLILGLSKKLNNNCYYYTYKTTNNEIKLYLNKSNFSLRFGSYDEYYFKDEFEVLHKIFQKKSNNKYFILDPEPLFFNSLEDYLYFIKQGRID